MGIRKGKQTVLHYIRLQSLKLSCKSRMDLPLSGLSIYLEAKGCFSAWPKVFCCPGPGQHGILIEIV